MISTTVSGKRPIEQVDDELLSLTAQQENEEQQQQRKRRRHQFAPMTQFNSNTLDEDSGFRSSSDVATADQDNFWKSHLQDILRK